MELTCQFCGHTGTDVNVYPELGKKIVSCDDIRVCVLREAENIKKKNMALRK